MFLFNYKTFIFIIKNVIVLFLKITPNFLFIKKSKNKKLHKNNFKWKMAAYLQLIGLFQS